MLYVIATPIGNLGDITLRAVDIFEKLDILLCEDTRRTGLLLQGLKINNRPKLESFYDEVEEKKIPLIITWLEEGKEVGLVTDGGTPLLSDPGWRLIRRCRESGIGYTALPGPAAVVNALVLSGLPMGRFCFLGFLPKKAGERKKILAKYKDIEGAKVVYESPLRTERLIAEIREVYGVKVQIRICREMTKMYEQVKTEWDGDKRGEVTVVFE